MDSYPPHLQSYFIPPQLQSLATLPPPYISTKQLCRILPAPKGILLAAGPAGRTSSRVSHWNARSSLSSPEFLPNEKNNRLIISRSLYTQQAVSSCLQHCLRSARYLPDFQSSSSPSVSVHRLPKLQNQIILFFFLFLGPIRTNTACPYPPLCASCVGIAGMSGVLQKKTQKNAPLRFTCTPTFRSRAFDSRKANYFFFGIAGGRTAWSSTVTVQGQNIAARYWYDGQFINNAKEDAAEVALKTLNQQPRAATVYQGQLFPQATSSGYGRGAGGF